MAVQKSDKWKFKKWYTILAPKMFNEIEIGEMPANSDKSALGRNIKVALSNLTNNPSNSSTNVILKVTDVNGNVAHTQIVEISQLYAYIRSLVRRYRSVASAVQPVKTKDDVEMVAKVIIITRGRTAHTKLIGLRKELEGYLKSYFSENEHNAAIMAIVEGRLQSELATKLNHIAPINKIEVNKLEIKS